MAVFDLSSPWAIRGILVRGRWLVDAMHSGALTQGSLLYCSQNLIQCQTCLLSPAPGARGECISSSCFNHYLLINFPVYGILYCISIVLFVYIFFSMFNWSEATTSASHMSVMGALKRFHQIGQRKHNTKLGPGSIHGSQPPAATKIIWRSTCDTQHCATTNLGTT